MLDFKLEHRPWKDWWKAFQHKDMQIFYNFKKKKTNKKKQSTLSVLLQENHATFWLHSSKKLYINVFHFFAIVRVKKSTKVI